MSTAAHTLTAHPIAGFTQRLHRVLDELTDAPAWSMTVEEQRATLVDLARAQARVEELWLRVLAAGDRADIAADSGATSTGAWLAHETRQSRGAAHADVKFACALDAEFGATRAALAAGMLDARQARMIVRAVQALPEAPVAADPTLPAQAERTLIELAQKHDAEERAAARSAYLQLHDNGDGTHTGRFKIPTLHAAMFRKALEAFTNPTHRHPFGQADASAAGADQPGEPDREPRRTRPELLGQAFCELIERLDPTRLPTSGGVDATMVLLLDYDKLIGGLGTAKLDTGERISAGLARRLACQAGIIPTVIRRLIDGRSVVLDMGRKRRLHSEHQRIALTIETRRLHHRRLRPARRLVSRPPRHPVVRRRRHQRPGRSTALPVPPPQGALPGLRHASPPRRPGPLPPENVTAARPAPPAGGRVRLRSSRPGRRDQRVRIDRAGSACHIPT